MLTDLQRHFFNHIPYVLLHFDVKNCAIIPLKQLNATEFSHENSSTPTIWKALSHLNDAVSEPDGIKAYFLDRTPHLYFGLKIKPKRVMNYVI